MTIFHTQQFWAVLLPATGFLPQLCWLNAGHQHFQRASGIHFFADDFLNLAQYAQAHGQPGVQAGSQLADHAGTQHQLMADHHGIGWGFFQS